MMRPFHLTESLPLTPDKRARKAIVERRGVERCVGSSNGVSPSLNRRQDLLGSRSNDCRVTDAPSFPFLSKRARRNGAGTPISCRASDSRKDGGRCERGRGAAAGAG